MISIIVYTHLQPSYLLDQRPVTAPKQLERAEYCKELNSQIKAIQHRLEEVEEQKKKAEEEYQKELAQRLCDTTLK